MLACARLRRGVNAMYVYAIRSSRTWPCQGEECPRPATVRLITGPNGVGIDLCVICADELRSQLHATLSTHDHDLVVAPEDSDTPYGCGECGTPLSPAVRCGACGAPCCAGCRAGCTCQEE